jgi:hypothetical protein
MKEYFMMRLMGLMLAVIVFLVGCGNSENSGPPVFNDNLILGMLQAQSELVVATQSVGVDITLPNETRQKLYDAAIKDQSLLDSLKNKLDDFLNGGEIRFRLVGEVIVSTNLGSMDSSDIQTDGNKKIINAPPVKIFRVRIDQEQSKPIYIEEGLWLKFKGNNSLQNEVNKQLETKLLKYACTSNMMEKGRDQAVTLIKELVKNIYQDRDVEVVVNVGIGECKLTDQ